MELLTQAEIAARKELVTHQPILFLIVSGASASGKDTILNEIQQQRTDIKKMSAYTTRKKRTNEIEGADYVFLNEEDINHKWTKREFKEDIIERTGFGSDRYFYDIKDIHKIALDNPETKIIYLIADYDGMIKIREQIEKSELSKNIYVKTLFIAAESLEENLARMEKRGSETEESFAFRVKHAKRQYEHKAEYDNDITNRKNQMEEALKETNFILDEELDSIVARQKKHRSY